MSDEILRGVSSLIPVLVSLLAGRGIYHLFQLESYQFPGYFRAVLRNPRQAWIPGLYSAAVSLGLLLLTPMLWQSLDTLWLQCVSLAAALLLAALFGRFIARMVMAQKTKKPFVFTARVKRLYAFSFIILAGISFALSLTASTIVTALWPLFLPLCIAFCGLIAWGLEKLISEYYFRCARRKLLSQDGLIRIGITGSYGKTSVKHILGTILGEKYPVLITPKSFNTPMGVARTIRERLLPSHQVFVAEMGARHVGDIKELCRLVKPTVGILTSVGPQHLETFKSIQRVAKTKYELIEALPEDGLSFFADDQAICKQLHEKTKKPKTIVSLSAKSADIWCEHVTVSPEGSSFDLCFANGERFACQTLLLGEHNILNILLAAAVAQALGLSKAQIKRGIRRIEPIPSRMELLKIPNSYTIINDGFNSNPISAQAALAILSQFPGRRIIVTPGMVELGEEQAKFNKEFGRQIAAAADIAILVGKRRVQPITDGLREAGFPAQHIHQVSSLEESTTVLRRIAAKDDTVLYENDLPDNYQEN